MAGKPTDERGRGGLEDSQSQTAYRTETGSGAETGPGLLIRAADGTLYTIPDDRLEQEPYRLPESEQPGSEQGDSYQDYLNACPPVHGVKNALRTPDGRLVEPLQASDPVSGTGARQKTSIPSLQELGAGTPELQKSKNWFQDIAPGDDPLGHLTQGEKGFLIRGADGTLYFLPEQDLADCKMPAEVQPEGIHAVLDDCPAVYHVKNALCGNGLTQKVVSGTGSRQKTQIDTLHRLGEQTPQARSSRGWSRAADPRTRR